MGQTGRGELVQIHNQEVQVIEYQGKRVITLDMMDALHERKPGTARLALHRNKQRLTLGKHYFVCLSNEAQTIGITAPNGLTLLTEAGYLKLVKSFRDDLAWDVQDALVETYFRAQAPGLPRVHDRRTQIAIDTLVRLDEAEHRIALLEDENRQKTAQLQRAETKADMALADAHRMTIEVFVGENGLLRQFPESTWPEAARWLARFCEEHGLETPKTPVPGKSWETEKTYPIQALMAWQRQAIRHQGQGRFLRGV